MNAPHVTHSAPPKVSAIGASGFLGLPGGSESACLLHGHINEVLILKPELLRGVVRRDAFTIHHEAHLGRLQPETAAIGIHELPEWSRLLDLELHLAALLVLHLQLDVGRGLCCGTSLSHCSQTKSGAGRAPTAR